MRLCVVALLFVLLSACGGSDPVPDNSNSVIPQVETTTQATTYFPLAVGNTWQYFVSVTESNGNTYEEYTYQSVNKLAVYNNHDVYNVKNDIQTRDGENENFFYSKLADGIVYHGASDPNANNQDVAINFSLTPPIQFLKSSFSVNDTWSTTSDFDLKEDGVTTANYPVTYQFTVEAIENVTVPAGTFNDCYKITINISSTTNPAAAETITLWLAENIGMVKQISDGVDFDFTQELQYVAVGGSELGQEVVFLGPTAYLSFDDSPFNGLTFTYFHLEDFEDQSLNTPGVTALPANAAATRTLGFPSADIDSVDGDDGAIDGLGHGVSGTAGESFFATSGSGGISFEFDATALGELPSHVGIVWTDGLGTTTFEAFDAVGNSLGTIGPLSIADTVTNGTTAEDRFFGIIDSRGISKIIISNTTAGIEVDHLQYGR